MNREGHDEADMAPTGILAFPTPCGFSAVCAVEVTSIPSGRVRRGAQPEDDAALVNPSLREHEHLVRSLAGAGVACTFALRYLVMPSRTWDEPGAVWAWLLARVDGVDSGSVREEIRQIGARMTSTLLARLPGYGARPLSSPELVAAAWRPLGEARPPFVTRFRRTTREVRLPPTTSDRSDPSGPLGPNGSHHNGGIVYAAIAPRRTTLSRVFRALLEHSHASLFQVAFRRWSLPAALEERLVSDAARLRKAISRPFDDSLSGEQIPYPSTSTEGRLRRLRREALLFDVAIASTEPPSPALLHLVAAELTGVCDRRVPRSRTAEWTAPIVVAGRELDGTAGDSRWRALDLDLEAPDSASETGNESLIYRLGDAREVVAAGFRLPVAFASEPGSPLPELGQRPRRRTFRGDELPTGGRSGRRVPA